VDKSPQVWVKSPHCSHYYGKTAVQRVVR